MIETFQTWLSSNPLNPTIAVAVAAPNLVMCLWVIHHTARGLDVSARRYVGQSWLRPMAASLAPLALWLLTGWAINDWTSLIAAIGVGLLPYAVVVWMSEFRNQHRGSKIPNLPKLLVPPQLR